MRELPVLVVEDEVLIEVLIRDGLTDAGYRVEAESAPADAIARLERQDCEWAGLVTDINLGPNCLTGWDIARRARELCPALPVVYVSGDSAHDWTSQGVPQSVMIPKPFATGQIVVALAELQNARTADV